MGRDQAVADIHIDNEPDTTSEGKVVVAKQHAAIQFRFVRGAPDEFGERTEGVKPYVIDLESKGGTWLNGRKIEASRFVELRDGDAVRFGGRRAQREWVVMLPS